MPTVGPAPPADPAARREDARWFPRAMSVILATEAGLGPAWVWCCALDGGRREAVDVRGWAPITLGRSRISLAYCVGTLAEFGGLGDDR